MVEHAGQWLFEEGMTYWHGSNFKKKDMKRGRLMIEAAASSGFPMALAFCRYLGWIGMVQDFKNAFEFFVKIEQETNGYHWAQNLLGACWRNGHGTDQDYTKAIEWDTKSSEQENSLAMCSLGVRNEKGQGCARNLTKAIEWYEKSAQLGYSQAMYCLGNCYKCGRGVTKDLNQARDWYTKAVGQGHEAAQKLLDELTEMQNSSEDDSDFEIPFLSSPDSSDDSSSDEDSSDEDSSSEESRYFRQPFDRVQRFVRFSRFSE